MLAAVLCNDKDLQVIEIPEKICEADEVKIRVKAAGVCGTDILVYEGLYTSNKPVVLGHEFAGIVEEVGEKVTGLKPGDSVTGRGSWACGKCHFCQIGKQSLCTNRKSLGRTVNGAMAEYVYLSCKAVHKLPDNVDMNDAQSFIPISCACHVLRRAEITKGQTVILFGSGHAALIILQVLKAHGVDKVIVVGGRRISRLKAATELGAAEVFSGAELDIQALSARKADVVIEASGSTVAFKNAVEVVKPGGVVLVFGIYEALVDQFDATQLYKKEISIIGSKGGGGESDSAIHLLGTKSISISPLISHHFKLTEIAEAFKRLSNKDETMFRVVIHPSN